MHFKLQVFLITSKVHVDPPTSNNIEISTSCINKVCHRFIIKFNINILLQKYSNIKTVIKIKQILEGKDNYAV